MKAFIVLLLSCLTAMSQSYVLRIATNAPSNGDTIVWSGSAWVPSAPSGGGSGTVTNVGLSTSLSGLTVGNSPVTTGGTITLSGTLGLGSGGTGATDAPGARTALSLVPGTDVQAYDADLAAIAALANSGIIVRTGAGTVSARTITGDSEAVVSNGDGVSGNPTLSIGATIARDSEVAAAYQPLDADLTAMAAGTAVATAQTNAVSFGAPVLYVGTTNVAEAIALKAPIASPALTGDPTVPTAPPGDNDTSAASTEFVTTAVAAVGGAGGSISGGPSTNYASPTVIVFEGDSITAATNSYSRQLTNLFQFNNLRWANSAISSSYLTDISNRYSTTVTANAPGAGTNGIFFLMIGVNDSLFNTFSGDTTNWFVGLTNYWHGVKTNGFKLIASTITPSTNFSVPNNINREQLNGWIRTSNIPDIVFDADRILPQTPSSSLNGSANYYDGLHPSESGHKVLANHLASLLYGEPGRALDTYQHGFIAASGGFIGDGSRISGLDGAKIMSGVVLPERLGTNTVVVAGSGITVATNSSGGVQSYTVSATAAASGSFGTKRNWLWMPTGSGTTVTGFGVGAGTSASAAAGVDATSTNNPYVRYSTSAASNNVAQIVANAVNLRSAKAGTLRYYFGLSDTNLVRAWVGAIDAAIFTADTGRRMSMFRYTSTNSPNWILTSSSAGSTTEAVDTGIVADTEMHEFRLEYTPSVMIGYIDSVPVATNSTQVSFTALLKTAMAVCTLGAQTNSFRFYSHYGEQDW